MKSIAGFPVALATALVLTTALAVPVSALGRSRRAAASSAPSAPKAAAAALGSVPFAFAEGAHGRFVAGGAGASAVLSNGEAAFAGPSGTVRVRFGRARSVRPEAPLAGVANFLVGRDRSAWRTNVATYERVRFEEIAPGVDLVFSGTPDRPEYDVVVAPGADPSAARVEVEGGDGRRATGGVGGALSYATYLGGNDDDRVNAAVADAAGNLYVVGQTLSSSFPVVSQLQNNQSGMDGFLAKFNPSGTALLFSTYVGGSGTDFLDDVAVDGAHIFVSGATGSENYPTANAYDDNLLDGGLDAVLTVLNLSGTAITYSTLIGGGNNDIGNAVAVDVHGNAFLAGETLDFEGIFSRNFPTKSPSSLDPFQTRFGGGRSDAFVCKFDPDESGNGSLVYSTLLGGSEGEGVEDIAVDEFERAYVCGYTESPNFDRLNALQNAYGGGTTDGFVTKFNADGTTIFYSTFYGGSAIDEAFGIALDTSGAAPLPVVVGHSTSTNLPTQLAIQPGKSGPEDAFAMKLDDSGTSFVYATYFGGPGNDSANAVVVDGAGSSYFTGFSNNTYPLLNPISVNGVVATAGATVTKLGPSGTLLLSTCVASGLGEGIGLDAAGSVYVAGTTSTTSFPVTPGAAQTTFHGAPNDGFAFKLDLVDDDTVGVLKGGTQQLQLRNGNAAGAADLTFSFGASGDRPIRGDWNGDGIDTIGAYTPATATFSLRNSNSAGAPFATFTFGAPNLVPISGDWDGDGTDTIGAFDPATGNFFLKNTNAGGGADLLFQFGAGGQNAVPVAGDWNGDGVDTIGFFVLSTRTWFLKNANAGGNADLQFVFGTTGAIPVAGDWDGDGVDTVGFFARRSFVGSGGRFSLRNSNAAGSADVTVDFGSFGDTPIAGNWDGI